MSFIRHKKVEFTASINNDNSAFLDGTTTTIPESVSLVSTLPLDYSLWHRCLGHHNYADVKKMIDQKLVTGIKLNSTVPPDPICEPCLAGKMRTNPFPSSTNHRTKPLQLIHSDVHGLFLLSMVIPPLSLVLAPPSSHSQCYLYFTDFTIFYLIFLSSF